MKKLLFIFGFLFILFPNTILSQHQNILVSGPLGNGQPSEPSIAINPNNTNELIIGAMTDHYFQSLDGGQTWLHGRITSTYGVMADPVIICDDQGSFYYIHLVQSMDKVLCQKKHDIESDWSNGTYTGYVPAKEVDKEWGVFDPVTGNMYISWTKFDTWGSSNPDDSSFIYISKSADYGQTWGDHKLISNEGGDASGGFYSAHGSYPATGPNGEVYVAWWSREGIMFDRSTNQAESWRSNDIQVLGYPVNWIYNIPSVQLGVTFPNIVCDRSDGPNHGNIYISWSDRTSGNSDVYVVKSLDGGDTWLLPIRVNDDGTYTHQFFSAMTIDQTNGNLYLVFYDRRNYSNINTDVYLAVSKDGGETFKNEKISETPFVPDDDYFFGHYIGIAAHDNVVRPAWTRMDNGNMRLYTAIINTDLVLGTEEINNDLFSLKQNYPNPFVDFTTIEFNMLKPSYVCLKIYDILGNEVVTLINGFMASGNKTITWSGKDGNNKTAPSGMYIYELRIDQRKYRRKLQYINHL